MAYADLHELIQELERVGELRRIAAEVDPDLEIAEITDRVSKLPGGGSALFFSNVRGSSYPVATNLFGNEFRVARALGCGSLDDLSRRMEMLLEGVDGAAGAAGHIARALEPYAPVVSTASPVHEVEETRLDLLTLPALRSWRNEEGKFLTLPLVFTCDPVTGATNCGMYRMQVLDSCCATINFGPGSGGGEHLAAWGKLSRPMPVAVALGGPPAVIFAATVPLPPEVDELKLAGFLGGAGIHATPACDGAFAVPAGADFLLEGEIVPGETATEGPFGNHTGFYSEEKPAPVFRLRKMARRASPVFPATVVGPPPMEDCYLARGWERLLLPWLRLHVPEVSSFSFIIEGIFHRAAVVAVGAGETADLTCRLRNCQPLRGARLLVLVDPEVSPADHRRVFWCAVNSLGAGTTTLLSEPAGMSLVIDARMGARGTRIDRVNTIGNLVTRRWKEYGFED